MPTIPILLDHHNLRARIDQSLGASLIDLQALHPRRGWLPIIARNVPDEDPRTNPACFFMAPWCNRIAHARFNHLGRPITLTPDPRDGHAIHGDVRKRPFNILDRTPTSARLCFDSRQHENVNWPWPFTAIARYELTPHTLHIEFTLTNASTTPFPCGVGIHPYFPRQQTHDQTRLLKLAAPVRFRYQSAACIPTGPATRDALARRLSHLHPPAPLPANDSFTGHTGTITLHWPDCHATLTSSPGHTHLVYFTPHASTGEPMPFVAVEPMTIPPNAFNLQPHPDLGVQTLQPSQSLTTTYTLAIEMRD